MGLYKVHLGSELGCLFQLLRGLLGIDGVSCIGFESFRALVLFYDFWDHHLLVFCRVSSYLFFLDPLIIVISSLTAKCSIKYSCIINIRMDQGAQLIWVNHSIAFKLYLIRLAPSMLAIWLLFSEIHYQILLLIMMIVICLTNIRDLWGMVRSKTTCLVNSVGRGFVRIRANLKEVLLVRSSQVFFKVFLYLATIMSVVDFAPLGSCLVLKVHVWVLDIGSYMMRL